MKFANEIWIREGKHCRYIPPVWFANAREKRSAKSARSSLHQSLIKFTEHVVYRSCYTGSVVITVKEGA